MCTKERKYLSEIAHYYGTLLSAEEPKEEYLDVEFVNMWYAFHLQKLINSVCGLELVCKNKYIPKETIMELIKFHDNSYRYIPKNCTRAEAIPKVKQVNDYLMKKIRPIISVILEMDKEAV